MLGQPITITARNVNDAFAEAMQKVPIFCRREDSRNGEVMVANAPVITTYKNPTERMLFHSQRDANPFFHIMEGAWMLAGRRDVGSIARYNSNIGQYSDNGQVFSAAYGHRWRQHFDVDQIYFVIEELTRSKTSRRAVMIMGDPTTDIGNVANGTKDAPCNLAVAFRVNAGGLDMTVFNRSNDIVWGCYGANAVHMSMLQEVVAAAIGVPVGVYYQFSNNWHIYERHYDLMNHFKTEVDPYLEGVGLTPMPMATDVNSALELLRQLPTWFDPSGEDGVSHPWIVDVLAPMDVVWDWYKAKDLQTAIANVEHIKDEAIALACFQWLQRRTV